MCVTRSREARTAPPFGQGTSLPRCARSLGPAPSARTAVGGVVIGGDYQGLGIVRSLGRHGVPVCIIDDEFSIGRFSQYATHVVQVPNLRDECQTVDTVLDVGRRLGLEGWVLYATRDETVAAFSRYRSALTRVFRVPTPDWCTVQWAWDKRNTYRLAAALGIPTPRTWRLCDAGDVELLDAAPPLVIKPAIKERFLYATKAKAWRADTRAELAARFRQAAALVGPGEVMIQEMIPGYGPQQFAYCAFWKNGQAVGKMVARRTRQHPLDFGRSSTFAESVDLPLLETMSEDFLRAINYYGLVEIEYKLDPRDGQYKLLDVNARTWGYHTLGSAAGVDFPYLLHADQVGEPVAPQQARTAVCWMHLVTDLPTAVLAVLRGDLSWRSYARSLWHVHDAVFCRDDLLPGLAELALIPYLYARRGF